MEGCDALEDGGPSELLERRYTRFATGGAGLIWFEAVAVCAEGRASKNQLYMTDENVDKFKELVRFIKGISTDVKIICQLTHSGRFSKPDGSPRPLLACHDPFLDARYPAHKDIPEVSDAYLDGVPAMYEKSARLAAEAGFDGVDIKACHRYLVSELLAAFTRGGAYGGSFENRTRLITDIFRAVRKYASPDFILASRLGVSDVIEYPYGFGVDKDDKWIPDFSEPIRLLNVLRGIGLSLVNVTMGTPYYNADVNKPHGADAPKSVDRLLNGAAVLVRGCPGLKFVSTGYSFLKSSAFARASEMLAAGKTDFVGFGRLAFAYPGFAADLLAGNVPADGRCCAACNKCSEILRKGGTAGCVIRDKEVYMPVYKNTVMN
jgi:2,4-dienoyl-CoA reductase-like NADH-dependent reductase (Old Yellow Enzyme family)